jgi:hypothetical protein
MCYDDGRNDIYRQRRSRRVCKLALLQIGLLIGFVLLGGVVYSTTLGYTFSDSIYLAVLTGSSIGFGDIPPSRTKDGVKSLAMIWFTIFYVFFFVTFILRFVTWISTEVYNVSYCQAGSYTHA